MNEEEDQEDKIYKEYELGSDILGKISWEKDVDCVQTIISNKNSIFVLLKWNDNKISKHRTEVCNEKCPKKVYFIEQKMLEYYQNLMVFTK